MRYRIVALLLLFVLPVMYPFAAPAPERPYAILDIGPPPKGKTAEEHRKVQIDILTGRGGLLFRAWCQPEVRKLRLYESVGKSVKGKEIYPWLDKTIRITTEEGGRRLRFTFQAGKHADQAVVINTLLRIYVQICVTEAIQKREKTLRTNEKAAPRLAKLIKEEPDANMRMKYQMNRDDSLARDAQFREDITRLRQVTVIKWAK